MSFGILEIKQRQEFRKYHRIPAAYTNTLETLPRHSHIAKKALGLLSPHQLRNPVGSALEENVVLHPQ